MEFISNYIFMDTLQALLARTSHARLSEPAPDAERKKIIFSAALTAPDHAQLRPWRFFSVEGQQRKKLGQLMLQAALEESQNLTEMQQEKILNAPLRAPLLVLAIASPKEHNKVPELEQQIAVGAAINNMLLACYAMNFGAIWRTGDICYNRTFKKLLGLTNKETVIGMLYIGTPLGEYKNKKTLDVNDFFKPLDVEVELE